jgi:hypothetical protein
VAGQQSPQLVVDQGGSVIKQLNPQAKKKMDDHRPKGQEQ